MSSASEQTIKRVEARDAQGRTLLFHYAACGDDEHVERLLNANWEAAPVDCTGVTPLHLAAAAGHSMVAYLLASKAYAACRVLDSSGLTPADTAAAAKKGEVLNAMLLACAGAASSDAVASLVHVIGLGAVPDTWAPDGSSALMLAAAVDNAEGVDVLLDAGASVELADALGRTALMFAAGRGAPCALIALLRAGASVAMRDRRGRNVMAYAAEDSRTHKLLKSHMEVLEKRASVHEAALLAAEALEMRAASPFLGGKAKGKKKGKRAKAVAAAADAVVSRGITPSLTTSATGVSDQDSNALVPRPRSPISQDGAQVDADAVLLTSDNAPKVSASHCGPQPSHAPVGDSNHAVSGAIHIEGSGVGVPEVASCGDVIEGEELKHSGGDGAGWVQVAKGGSRRFSATGDCARVPTPVPRPGSAGADSTPRKRSVSVASISSCDTDSSAGSAWTHLGGCTRGKPLMQRHVGSKLAPAPASVSAPGPKNPPLQGTLPTQDINSAPERLPALARALPAMHATASRQVPGRLATGSSTSTLQEELHTQQCQQQQPVAGTWASKVAGRSVSCGNRSPAPGATKSGAIQLVSTPLQDLHPQPPSSGPVAPHPSVPSPPTAVTSPAVHTAFSAPLNAARDAFDSDGKLVALAKADRVLTEALMGDIAALLMVQLRHQGEVDLILRDAAAHEAHAVSLAVAAERAACAEVFGAYMRCPPAVAAALAEAVRYSVSDNVSSAVNGSEHAYPPQLLKPNDRNGSWEGGAHNTIRNHTRQRSSALDAIDALQRLQLDGAANTGFAGQEGIQLDSRFVAAAEPLSSVDPGPSAVNGGILHDDPFALHSLPQQSDTVAVQPHQYLSAARGMEPASSAGLGCGIFGASAVWGMRSPTLSGQL